MKVIKSISFYIVISFVICLSADLLKSVFLFEYLKNNIIGLLLTLLAINTATSGLIASKMQDLVLTLPDFDFSNSIKEMKLSLLEQIILIIFSVITLIVQDSDVIIFNYKDLISNVILVTVLIYSINILWDTGKSVFVVIEEIQKLKKSND